MGHQITKIPVDIRSAINTFVRMMQPLQRSSGVILAVSGGSDSLGLMKLATLAIPSVSKIVGFVDHGLREGTALEWTLVQNYANQLGIDAVRLFIDAEQIKSAGAGEGLQQWARVNRYQLLKDLAAERGFSFIATGHTIDDQAETVLLRILRGSGVDGLGGIPEVRAADENIDIIRPLLGVSRRSIQEWLKNEKINWADDPSNENRRFARVRIRKELLPLMGDINRGITGHLARLASESARMSDFFNNIFSDKKILNNIVLHGGVKVKHDVFKEYPHEVHSRIVRFAIDAVKGNLRRIERVHIEPVVEGLLNGKGTSVYEMPGGTFVSTAYGDLYVLKTRPLADKLKKIVISPQISNDQFLFKSTALGVTATVSDVGNSVSDTELIVRTRQQGDWIGDPAKRLSRLFTKYKIPEFYRDFIPLLVSGKSSVVAIPGLLDGVKYGININWSLTDDCPLADLKLFSGL